MTSPMMIPNPATLVSYETLKANNLLDRSFVERIESMPTPKCGPLYPGGPKPKCIGYSKDGYVTNQPIVNLNGVSPASAKKLKKAGLETIGDMLDTKNDFRSPSFSERVGSILRRVKAGVQKARLSDV